MFLLVIGVTLWIFAHGFKALFPTTRQQLTTRWGEDKAKGPFAMGIFASIILIIVGWRQSDPTVALYHPPDIMILIAGPLIVASLYLLIGSSSPLRVRKRIRHPQLTGFALLAIAHLLTNGELRSVILFSGFTFWALILIPCINRRDGSYSAPDVGSIKAELKPVVITLVTFVVLALTHGIYTAEPLINW